MSDLNAFLSPNAVAVVGAANLFGNPARSDHEGCRICARALDQG